MTTATNHGKNFQNDIRSMIHNRHRHLEVHEEYVYEGLGRTLRVDLFVPECEEFKLVERTFISCKYQQSSGSAWEKIPYEISKMAEHLPSSSRKVIVMGGPILQSRVSDMKREERSNVVVAGVDEWIEMLNNGFFGGTSYQVRSDARQKRLFG